MKSRFAGICAVFAVLMLSSSLEGQSASQKDDARRAAKAAEKAANARPVPAPVPTASVPLPSAMMPMPTADSNDLLVGGAPDPKEEKTETVVSHVEKSTSSGTPKRETSTRSTTVQSVKKSAAVAPETTRVKSTVQISRPKASPAKEKPKAFVPRKDSNAEAIKSKASKDTTPREIRRVVVRSRDPWHAFWKTPLTQERYAVAIETDDQSELNGPCTSFVSTMNKRFPDLNLADCQQAADHIRSMEVRALPSMKRKVTLARIRRGVVDMNWERNLRNGETGLYNVAESRFEVSMACGNPILEDLPISSVIAAQPANDLRSGSRVGIDPSRVRARGLPNDGRSWVSRNRTPLLWTAGLLTVAGGAVAYYCHKEGCGAYSTSTSTSH
ncbi:MAG: hypothetical protein M3Q24_00290 [bacterium]|nr:hypothetical protein [bacterium]